MSPPPPTKRFLYLETARGVASVIVVFHHFLLGFLPSLKNFASQGGLKGTPLYILVNGSGAVAFFFLLSGFVLTYKFYQNFVFQSLAASVLKRLPRLMLPAGLSMMIGACILIYYPHAYGAAAKLTGSQWLADFAGAGLSKDFVPSFVDATIKSLAVFLKKWQYQYNSNLWTMFYEFYGSMLVFAMAAVFCTVFRSKELLVVLLHIILAALCVVLSQKFYLPFVIGSLIAYVHCNNVLTFSFGRVICIGLTMIMFTGFSVDNWYALTIASTAAMILLLGIPSLEPRLSHPIGLFLGRLSFPLYLVHVLVILSVTSAAFTQLTELGLSHTVVLSLCLAITWIFSLLASIPFMTVETYWVAALNRWSRALFQNNRK